MRASVATALALASSVSGHAVMYGIWDNGKDLGAGKNTYIRSPPNNSPVKDLTSPDLVCNVNGGTAVPEFAQVAAGDELTFEWYHDNRGDDIIDGSHKGPIITYIAEYTEGDGTGAIWSKIAEAGYDGSEWAVTKLIANGGKIDVTLPADLKAGKYLLRQEIIALHESDAAYSVNSARGAQFYPSCVQVEVTGSGSAVPDQNFDFNTGYTYSDPGIVFNLYGSFTSYDIPGPEIWTPSGSGSGSGSSSSVTSSAAPSTAAPTATASSAPASSAPAATSVAAPATTLATFVSSAAPVATQATQAPVSSAAPTSSTCSRRRRRRRSTKKNANKSL